MRDFVIMTDSCCDLPEEVARELGLASTELTKSGGESRLITGSTKEGWNE